MVPYEATKTRIDFRSSLCKNSNLCYTRKNEQNIAEKLLRVTSWKQYCELENKINVDEELREVEGVLETEAECMKRKNLVRICPKKTMNAIGKIISSKKFTDYKKINKEMKKKGRKKRKKGQRKKRKSKKKKSSNHKKKRGTQQ